MTDATAVQLFWVGVIVIGFLLPLILGAIWIEVIAPKNREWIRRLRANELGRRAQGRAR